MLRLLRAFVLVVLLRAAAGFFGDGVFGSHAHSPDVNWACCAKRHLHRHARHFWGWKRGRKGAAAKEDTDCQCPIDKLFPGKDTASERQWQRCRDEKERLRAEKARDLQRCQSDKSDLRKEKARESQRCRSEKDLLRAQYRDKLRQSDAQARSEAQRCRDEKAELRAKLLQKDTMAQKEATSRSPAVCYKESEKARAEQQRKDVASCSAEKERLRSQLRDATNSAQAANKQREAAERKERAAEKGREDLHRRLEQADRLRKSAASKVRVDLQRKLAATADQLSHCKSSVAQLRVEGDGLRGQFRALNASVSRAQAQLKEREQTCEQRREAGTSGEACRSQLLAAEAAKRGLQGDLKEEKRSRMRMWSRLQAERDSKAALKKEVRAERRMSQHFELTLDKERASSLQIIGRLEATRRAAGSYTRIACSLVAIGISSIGLWLLQRLSVLQKDLAQKTGALSAVERDLGLVTDEALDDGDFDARESNSSFVCSTSWQESDEETVRCVKIRCPQSVEPGDVTVDVLFNGCSVAIATRGEAGVETWSKRFQFRLSEGLYEFAEERAKLEDGCLTLVFRPYASHSRIFRFPRPLSAGSGGVSSPKLSSSAASWVDRAMAKPAEGVPEYYLLASHAGDGSSVGEEPDEEGGEGLAAEAPSSPKPDSRGDPVEGLDSPEPADVLAEEDREEDEGGAEADGDEREDDGEEALLATPDLGVKDEALLAAEKPSEPEERTEVAESPATPKSAEAAGERSAAEFGGESPDSPATSEGFEKVDTSSSVADDQVPSPAADLDEPEPHDEGPALAPAEDDVARGPHPLSEGYDEVLDVDPVAEASRHDSEDMSDYELL